MSAKKEKYKNAFDNYIVQSWRGIRNAYSYKIYLIYVLLLLVMYILYFNNRVLFVTTPSIPYRFCWQRLNIEPQKGDLCVFTYNNNTFIKYLVGKQGDKIKVINHHVYVDNYDVGKVVQDKNLTPIEYKEIPTGYVFVAGTHPESLDSRYKEFGLIPKSALKGKAIGFIKR